MVNAKFADPLQDVDFLKTYPQFKFEFDLKDLDSEIVKHLKSAERKCRNIEKQFELIGPLKGQKLYNLYLSRGIHSSASIEGNPMSEENVKAQVLQRQMFFDSDSNGESKKTSGRPQTSNRRLSYNEQEIENIFVLYEKIRQSILTRGLSGEYQPVTPKYICEMNGIVLNDLELGDRIKPGKIRVRDIRVGNYVAPHAKYCKQLLQYLCDFLLRGNFLAIEEEYDKFFSTVLKAILAHLYLVSIHPFGDGNGRTSRALELQILAEGEVPLLATHLFANHYNKTRQTYYSQLEKYQFMDPSPNAFILYALKGFLKGLDEQLKDLAEVKENMALEQAWIDQVHFAFKNINTPPTIRQKLLALEIPMEIGMEISEIRLLSKEIERAYRQKTDKTITRDLGVLEKLGLIERRGDRVFRR